MADPGTTSAGPFDAHPVVRYTLAAIGIVLGAAALAVHGRETLLRFPPGRSADALPFTENDHPFHYYYSQRTRDFAFGRGAFWGYDPTFMAGYAKTLIFPTSSTLAELVGLVWRGAAAYRALVAATIWLTPLALALAARRLAQSWSAGLVALCVGVIWMWCGLPAGWPIVYVTWGMGPFILASALSLWSGVSLADWLDRPTRRSLVVGGLLAAVATIAHPSSPVILVAMLLPAYVRNIRVLSARRHLVAWSVPVAVILLWSPWWIPPVVLSDTYGSTATGFVNENVLGRIDELANVRFVGESALIAASLAASAGLYERGRWRRRGLLAAAAIVLLLMWGARLRLWTNTIADSFLVVGAAELLRTVPAVVLGLFAAALVVGVLVMLCWGCRSAACSAMGGTFVLFLIAYFGGAFPWMWSLQPGRYTQPFYGLLVVLVAAGCSAWIRTLRTRPRKIGWWSLAAAVVMLASAAGLAAPELSARARMPDGALLRSELPAVVRELADHLRTNTDSTGRILFEDRGRVSVSPDPLAGTNPSALLPLLAPGQYIGGPYLYTHLKTNFTQFGDGKFFGHSVQSIDRATFERYARLYNVRWMVCWSRPMVRLAQSHGDLFHEQARFGSLIVYEVVREANWAVAGTARVQATPDRLLVSNARAASTGPLVLSYHWIATLRAPVPIRPMYLEDDPVPFIAVDDPPNEFVIENRLW